MRRTLACFVLTLAVLSLTPLVATAGTSRDNRTFVTGSHGSTPPGRIYAKTVVTSTAGTWRFRTTQCDASMDTVLHVYRSGPTYGWLGSNDDVRTSNCTDLQPGGLESCFDVTLAAGGAVQVFVHRYGNTEIGRCRFVASVNGHSIVNELFAPRGDTTSFWVDAQSNTQPIQWAAGESLQTAYTAVKQTQPGQTWQNGMLWPVVLVLAGPEKLVTWANHPSGDFTGAGFGIWGQTAAFLSTASSAIPPVPSIPYAHRYVVGQYYYDDAVNYPWRYGDGSLRFYRNDAGLADADGDNLGDQLEAALGTCASSQACSGNPVDTDGDGLRDDWEVIGGCTFNGCAAGSSDQINFAFYGADPLVKDFMVQVDWMDAEQPENRVDKWNILEPALERVKDRYAAETSSIGAAKEPIHVFFDYGQLSAGGRGGNSGPAWGFCLGPNAVPECANPSVPWAACGPLDSCPSGLSCITPCQGEKVCVSTECAAPCKIDQSCHLYNGRPYSLQTIIRGAPGGRYSYMPRNRRGTFAELFMPQGWNGETAGYAQIAGIVNHSTCSFLGGELEYPSCKFIFPGWTMILRGTFTPPNGSFGESTAGKIQAAAHGVFHELGHVVGLLDGAIQPTTTACVTDADCPPLGFIMTRCRGGMCVEGWNYAPNHQSSMNYLTTEKKRVDLAGNIDYASGLRPSLRGFSPIYGSGVCPTSCPPLTDPSCPLNGITDPEIQNPNGRCCLGDTCVAGGLDESVGIGDYFGEGGNLYIQNRDWQLARMQCIQDPTGLNTGPQALDLILPTASIDWNWNNLLDSSLVGEFLMEWDAGCFDYAELPMSFVEKANTHTYTDTDEWGFIADVGFWNKGISTEPGLWQVGTPVCGDDEGIVCPSGYSCDLGQCTPSGGLMPLALGASGSRGAERQGFACPLD